MIWSLSEGWAHLDGDGWQAGGPCERAAWSQARHACKLPVHQWMGMRGHTSMVPTGRREGRASCATAFELHE